MDHSYKTVQVVEQGHKEMMYYTKMFLNTKSKAASVTKVAFKQVIDIPATHQKLHCLVSPNSDIACHLFITPILNDLTVYLAVPINTKTIKKSDMPLTRNPYNMC